MFAEHYLSLSVPWVTNLSWVGKEKGSGVINALHGHLVLGLFIVRENNFSSVAEKVCEGETWMFLK